MPAYFAYGSNLDRDDWTRYCAGHGVDPDCLRPIEPALLPDAELAFNYRSESRNGGALNLVPRRGQIVHGVLFDASDEAWRLLDIKEGVAAGQYARSERVAIVRGGRAVPVITYEVRPERIESFVTPAHGYVDIVARGLSAHGLPRSQLDAVARGERPAPAVDGLFVYGTLMRGESRFSAIGAHRPRCMLLANGPGRLHETAGDYPMMDLDTADASDIVRGEYMQVAAIDAALEALDAIEDFAGYGGPANEYLRTLVEIDAGEEQPRLAWTYAASNRRIMGARIASGSWRQHRGVNDEFFQRLVAAHHGGNDAFLQTLTSQRVLADRPGETSLVALAQALGVGRVSERSLSLLSGRWSALAE